MCWKRTKRNRHSVVAIKTGFLLPIQCYILVWGAATLITAAAPKYMCMYGVIVVFIVFGKATVCVSDCKS